MNAPVKITAEASDGTMLVFDSLTEAAKEGFTKTRIRACLDGVQKTHAGYTWKRHGALTSDYHKRQKHEGLERRRAFVIEWLEGSTYARIAKSHHLTKQRVQQLVTEALAATSMLHAKRKDRHLIEQFNAALTDLLK